MSIVSQSEGTVIDRELTEFVNDQEWKPLYVGVFPENEDMLLEQITCGEID